MYVNSPRGIHKTKMLTHSYAVYFGVVGFTVVPIESSLAYLEGGIDRRRVCFRGENGVDFIDGRDDRGNGRVVPREEQSSIFKNLCDVEGC